MKRESKAEGQLMFGFVSRNRPNPLSGACPHNCLYCYAKKMIRELHMTKYEGPPRIKESDLAKMARTGFKPDEVVFVCTMTDLFAERVQTEAIIRVLEIVKQFPRTWFLFLTKNPKRYLGLLNAFPPNAILGATIESNRNYPQLSQAPPQTERLKAMIELNHRTREKKLFVCAEPVLDFDADEFAFLLSEIKPWLFAIGFDNHGFNLPEPDMQKVVQLISKLQLYGINVHRKTMKKTKK